MKKTIIEQQGKDNLTRLMVICQKRIEYNFQEMKEARQEEEAKLVKLNNDEQ